MADIPSTSALSPAELASQKEVESSTDTINKNVVENDLPPNEEDDEFVVEKILNMKTGKDGTKLFYIKWKGFPESENSWEPEENCIGAVDLIAEYKEERKKSAVNRKRKQEETNKQEQEKKRTIEIPDDGGPRGFHRGLQAQKILGASTDSNGELMFLMKWKGCEDCDFVKSCQANIKCPQIVIAFYEERLNWYGDEILHEPEKTITPTDAVASKS